MNNKQKREIVLGAKTIHLNVQLPTSKGSTEILLTRDNNTGAFERFFITKNKKDCCTICGGRHYTSECRHTPWRLSADSVFKKYRSFNWKPSETKKYEIFIH